MSTLSLHIGTSALRDRLFYDDVKRRREGIGPSCVCIVLSLDLLLLLLPPPRRGLRNADDSGGE